MAASVTGTALTEALVNELVTALAAMLGAEGALTEEAATVAEGWSVTVTVGEPLAGSITLAFGAEDCTRLVSAITGEAAPDAAATADLLRELIGQAVGSLREKPEGKGRLFCVESPQQTETGVDEASQTYTITLGADLAPRVAVWSRFEERTATAAAPKMSASAALRGRQADTVHAPAVPANLDVILDIDLPLSVRFGQTDLTLEALSRLGPGSVIDLGRSPDEPVDVLVNGRLVARAEVVVVAGNYGVRITEVVSTADRVRTLSG